jgi:hypothetical protein
VFVTQTNFGWSADGIERLGLELHIDETCYSYDECWEWFSDVKDVLLSRDAEDLCSGTDWQQRVLE